jgi:hypothetical protein
MGCRPTVARVCSWAVLCHDKVRSGLLLMQVAVPWQGYALLIILQLRPHVLGKCYSKDSKNRKWIISILNEMESTHLVHLG